MLEILGEALPVWRGMLNSIVLQTYKHLSPEALLHTGSSFPEKGLNRRMSGRFRKGTVGVGQEGDGQTPQMAQGPLRPILAVFRDLQVCPAALQS